MKHSKGLLLSWLVLVLGCSEAPKSSEAKSPEAAPESTGLTFAFSRQEAVSGNLSDNDWCRVPLSEAAVVSPDPVNVNRRRFALAEGPHRVVIDLGKFAASFVLQKKGNQVEIFTSDNFPECLSNRVNFTIQEGGTTFQYDNKSLLDFEVQLEVLPNGTQIALEMAPGAGYGIVVRR